MGTDFGDRPERETVGLPSLLACVAVLVITLVITQLPQWIGGDWMSSGWAYVPLSLSYMLMIASMCGAVIVLNRPIALWFGVAVGFIPTIIRYYDDPNVPQGFAETLPKEPLAEVLLRELTHDTLTLLAICALALLAARTFMARVDENNIKVPSLKPLVIALVATLILNTVFFAGIVEIQSIGYPLEISSAFLQLLQMAVTFLFAFAVFKWWTPALAIVLFAQACLMASISFMCFRSGIATWACIKETLLFEGGWWKMLFVQVTFVLLAMGARFWLESRDQEAGGADISSTRLPAGSST